MARKRKTRQQFIEDSMSKHGERYDYSKVRYRGSQEKVRIICKVHGEFTQRTNDHLKGHGCPSCAGLAVPTTGEWIEKAKEVHGTRYDYNRVNYQRSRGGVTIGCPEHGDYVQTASHHLQGAGCHKCAKIR